MKLQKLLFYSHAWHLAIYNKPLFDPAFEAWSWGPVVKDVYFQTRKFGTQPVTGLISEVQKTDFDLAPSDFNFVAPEGVQGDELKAFIKNVWDVHKEYSGIQLSNSTHAPGEPWTIVKDHYGNLEHKPIIPNELIAAVFKKKLENANPSSHRKTC